MKRIFRPLINSLSSWRWPRQLLTWIKLRLPRIPGQVVPWRQVVVHTILTAYLYVILEWFFYVTKPSFMDGLALPDKLTIPLVSGLMATLPALAALLLVYLLNLFLGRHLRWFDVYSRHLPAAFLVACLGLVMLDDFTYVVLNFGIVDAKNALRLIYVFLLLLFIYKGLRAFAALTSKVWLGYATTALVVVSLGLAIVTLRNESALRNQPLAAGETTRRPNIILFGTDGLNAANMSLYGYERETTPFLDELAKSSLMSLNHFTNSGHSMGSDTSLLTGKLVFDTRVLYPPDILVGRDKYQHLPGILQQNGYYTTEMGVKYYVDANQVNFQNAFDAINCQANTQRGLLDRIASLGYDNAVYMFETVTSRIRERVRHIFFIEDMVNPFSMVTENDQAGMDDNQRLDCLRKTLAQGKETGQPVFAHVHLMGTHGSKFTLEKQVFSLGLEQDRKWMVDFYDDTVLRFDSQVSELVDFLKETGQYENTILVIYTDHGEGWTTTQRLPLIIHFPGDENVQTISAPTQNLDIAPTLLDSIGLEVPAWMSGSSLLQPLEPARLIISGKTNQAIWASELFMLNADERKPPFYQFTELTVVQCQNWYHIDLEKLIQTGGIVRGFKKPCSARLLDSGDSIHQQVGGLLVRLGYDLPAAW